MSRNKTENNDNPDVDFPHYLKEKQKLENYNNGQWNYIEEK